MWTEFAVSGQYYLPIIYPHVNYIKMHKISQPLSKLWLSMHPAAVFPSHCPAAQCECFLKFTAAEKGSAR